MTRRLPLIAALWLCCAAPASAQMPVPPATNPADDVSNRVRQLEGETQSLRAEVERLREQPVRLPPVDATQAAPATPSPTMAEVDAEIKKFAWKKGDFAIVPYGCLWGNIVDSTERTYPGSYTLYALSANTGPESEFIVDARNTRVGTDVIGPRIPCLGGAQSGGKVEVDFQQSLLSTENKASVLLRHAYAEVRNDDFRLLAGQTWDVINPLNPCMLMYSIGWDAGNIGYRRAQLRGERYFAISDTSLITTQLSANQNIFCDSTTSIRPENPQWPIVEGRVAWTIGERKPECQPITVGVSGHIGEEEFDVTGGPQDEHRRTWSGNIDIRVPITERFGVQAELYVGDNLDAFFGGIGQGIDPVGRNTIRDQGGWFEFWYKWTPTLHSHFGYFIDDPNDNDMHVASARTYNQFYFGNLCYDVTKTIVVGAEVSSWRTLYLGQLPGDAVRCEFVVKYGF